MKQALLVALGGAIGSVARWLVTLGVQRMLPSTGLAFPWGTFTVNAIGSFAIGMLLATHPQRGVIALPARLFLVTGVLGGFTTFSAFSWESLSLLRSAQWPAAFAYVAGSVMVGLGAAFAGVSLATRL